MQRTARLAIHVGSALLAALLAACGGDDGQSSGAPGLSAAQLNALHGMSGACGRLENCRLAERVDLLFQWIGARGCPDVVTLQEVWRVSYPLIVDRLGSACPFTYEGVVGTSNLGPDEEMVLSRYPVMLVERQPLFPGFRKVMHVRIDHPLGPVDVYTTHLASGSDGGPLPCDPVAQSCPAECLAAGAPTRRDCQAVQVARYVEATHDLDSPAVVSGDLNSDPGSFAYRQFTERGWADVFLAAGKRECNPASGAGCTSGRADEDLSQLESPAVNESERIDFVFLVPPRNGFPCTARIDPPGDPDGDGTGTRLFADRPNPFAPRCGAAPLPICWPSDHEGVQLDLNCR